MNDCARNARQPRLAGPRRGAVVGCAVVVWLAAASLCGADEPGDELGPTGGQQIALNQGVDLQQTSAAAVAPPQDAHNRAPSESADPPVARRDRRGQSLPPTDLRRARLSRSSTTAGPSEAEPTPWYRTGFGALATVLVLIGAAVWAAKRWMPSARAADSGVLRVVGRAALSSKQSVALIQLGRRFVMVGISGDRLNRLCEVGDPDEVAELAARTGTTSASRAGAFDDLLLREAADFGKGREGDLEEARSVRTGVGRSPKRLAGLLQRLRTLQAK